MKEGKKVDRKEEGKDRKDIPQVETGFYQYIVWGSLFSLKCVKFIYFLSSSIHGDKIHIIQSTMLSHIIQRKIRNYKC